MNNIQIFLQYIAQHINCLIPSNKDEKVHAIAVKEFIANVSQLKIIVDDFDNKLKRVNVLQGSIKNSINAASKLFNPDTDRDTFEDLIVSYIIDDFSERLLTEFGQGQSKENILKRFNILWKKCNEHRNKVFKILRKIQYLIDSVKKKPGSDEWSAFEG